MNAKKEIQPVILCGGSGTRLWPLSRLGFPKQFLSLIGDESLFQSAVKRLDQLGAEDIKSMPPIIVTGEAHRFLVLEQIREVKIELSTLLLEPVGKNTAPALTLAALAALKDDRDPVLVVTPADQSITDLPAFIDSMHSAIRLADSGEIVLLGIPPDHAATGYGYVQTEYGDSPINVKADIHCEHNAFVVKNFIEKPDLANAQKYIKQKEYFWNAGIFVMKASIWMQALKLCRGDIAKVMESAWNNRTYDSNLSSPFVRPGRDEFLTVPSESIDYAVMERIAKSKFALKMIPLEAGWSDLGTWDKVWDFLPKDEDGNVCRGDVITVSSNNSLVHAGSRLVSVVGANNLVVVETPDSVLVADKSFGQGVKEIFDKLSASGRDEHVLHRKVHRPWGWYDSIESENNFKVKRLRVNPGASLSLQKHQHRAEHWVVVKGTAEIYNDAEVSVLRENQSTFIPQGAVHRLSNPGVIPLEIIEIQSGSYFGEDDIERFDDSYGRHTQ